MPFHLPTEDESKNFAACLAKHIKSPLVLTFSGEIGMGKTTLIRFMLQALGVSSSIKSPTFSLVESYELGQSQLHHFDLYRICDEEELEYIGFRDYFGSSDICCIEWPERVSSNLLRVDLAINLVRQGDGRLLHADAISPEGLKLLTGIEDSL
ncbi:MAG: tRNA (adenosine(37)-N6)-threonylcarbamoyltransferase complex ATPase subunit type 1 TsaE [Legionellaceae bacterium]|nr:tRNA (adenosine(37)-N6)-threonylcarbamoyltransferase complex ATPase subunit type 1 TsaE [Legionellaceae bacterium]